MLPIVTFQINHLHPSFSLGFAFGGIHTEMMVCLPVNPVCVLGVHTASVTGLPGTLPALALELPHPG